MNTQDRGNWTSASAAEADSLCPGRHRAQLGLPETQSDDAEFGTKVHAALAKGSPEGLDLKERDSYDSCQTIEAKALSGFFGAAIAGRTPKGLRENRLWMRFGELYHSGQPDVLHRIGSRAIVIEYKTLGGDVPASPRNLQLRDQVCLLYHNTALLDEIGCAVIQPFATWTPEVCVYSKEDIQRATAEMFERVAKSNDPASPRIAGDLQCKFCRAKANCLEYQHWATQHLPMKLLLPDGLPMAQWTGEQFAAVLDLMPRFETFAAQLDMEAKRRLAKEPGSINGYALKENKPLEKVNDPQECFNRLLALARERHPDEPADELHTRTLKAYMTCLTVGKEKLREWVAGILGSSTKKPLDAAMAKLTEGITTQIPKASSLVKVKEEK